MQQRSPETFGRHPGFEVGVGRGDQSHVDLARLFAADRPNFASLERAQQQGLHLRRGFADFVEKQGAAVGLGEKTAPVAIGTGIGAAGGAKKFGRRQGRRQGRPC